LFTERYKDAAALLRPYINGHQGRDTTSKQKVVCFSAQRKDVTESMGPQGIKLSRGPASLNWETGALGEAEADGGLVEDTVKRMDALTEMKILLKENGGSQATEELPIGRWWRLML
jgi:hypothetical protein